ncbi:hypothetical protein [Xanthobacter autotrophicus]|uniref:hypothetical protein n=1 Tax=Xanthobacter autotrophicus TaxID=280 RepID=UPI003734CBAC
MRGANLRRANLRGAHLRAEHQHRRQTHMPWSHPALEAEHGLERYHLPGAGSPPASFPARSCVVVARRGRAAWSCVVAARLWSGEPCR